eukprot:m.124454 g.124454  ORF g.124454 m.124454 type:complete len:71 (-) comp17286_c0_seq1:2099-2311(-)
MWTESLPALGIICAAIAASGFGIRGIHSLMNNGKPRRLGVDTWDKQLIDRDATITGHHTVQTSDIDHKRK